MSENVASCARELPLIPGSLVTSKERYYRIFGTVTFGDNKRPSMLLDVGAPGFQVGMCIAIIDHQPNNPVTDSRCYVVFPNMVGWIEGWALQVRELKSVMG